MLKVTLAAAWLMASIVAAQTPDPPKPASSGVYSAAQAERGKNQFALLCTGCHTAASQSGEPFAKKWNGAAVSDLFAVLTEQMPKDDPGSLSPAERADVIAYLLKLNGMTAGTTDLSSDPEQLKKIVIDLVK